MQIINIRYDWRLLNTDEDLMNGMDQWISD